MRLRSSSRWSRKPMVGICSLADSLTGESAAASGIGRHFRSFNPRSGRSLGRRGKPRLHAGFFFRGLQLFGRRRIKDTVRQRSERSLEGRQDLLAGIATGVEGMDFGLDLRTEFVRSPPELVEEARHLA